VFQTFVCKIIFVFADSLKCEFLPAKNQHFITFVDMRILFFCLLSVLANAQVSIVKGPYLQVGTANSMIIKWETNIPTDTKVEYDTSATSMNYFAGSLVMDTVHEVQLSGLLPYTKYYYNIGTKTTVIQGDTNNYFVTSPLPGQTGKYRFWITGDCGNLSVNQLNCKNQYNNYNKNRLTNGWLLLGDNAYYYGANNEYNAQFFAVYQTDVMKHAVLWPAPGNHDYSNGATTTPTVPYYDIFSVPSSGEAGGVPSGTESYYSFDYGNIHFVSLDSYGASANKRMYDTTSQQALWLKQDLAANHSRWTVVYFHHPPYTMGSHNSDTEVALDSVRSYFVKMLEHYEVDLVMSGHSHDYERAKLMRGHYGKEATFSSGTHHLSASSALYDGSINSCPYLKDSVNNRFGSVYVVAGSAGQVGGMQASFPHDAMYYSNATDGGTFILDVEDNRLDGKWLCGDGVIRDKLTMFKDVNRITTYYIDTTQSANLTASWPGNYIWSTGDTLRSITVSPNSSTTYWVKDTFSCIADTFKILVTPVGIKDLFLGSGKYFKVFPNPGQDDFVIEFNTDKPSAVLIKVFSETGTMVRSFKYTKIVRGKNTLELNNLNLEEGIYFIQFSSGEITSSEKLIIAR
jgi:hypothetical protein